MYVKLNHSAAITLVSWVLILPPLRLVRPPKAPNAIVQMDTNAPLTQWTKIGGKFETESQCRAYPFQKKEQAKKVEWWLERGQCVRANDPRLAN